MPEADALLGAELDFGAAVSIGFLKNPAQPDEVMNFSTAIL
jgi:hypothetical protein